MTFKTQARDEARQERDEHLGAIGPAYQAGFVQGQRDLLLKVRAMLKVNMDRIAAKAVEAHGRDYLSAWHARYAGLADFRAELSTLAYPLADDAQVED